MCVNLRRISLSEPRYGEARRVHRHNDKKRLSRNILDFLKSGSFNQCQECGNGRQLQGMVYLCGCCEVSVSHISYSVRLRVAHSTLVGSQSLRKWDEQDTGSHAFFYLPQSESGEPIGNVKVMKEKKDELQSRRSFFKAAAKGVLPILGAIALANVPLVGRAATHESQNQSGCDDCYMWCVYNCYNTCKDTCSNTCKGTCITNCDSSCQGTCRYSCLYVAYSAYY